ncbi:hypothetical protein ADEAN_000921100 [Angomonas deanei]|uniref:Uncharacterized protein n=1 Tax=Angomonas deanei TaxID=59799 RepID=A0A7G2CQL8_9TRYP|nr:hypothetical protein ADEAN_000921100 [Angomonas deanei]
MDGGNHARRYSPLHGPVAEASPPVPTALSGTSRKGNAPTPTQPGGSKEKTAASVVTNTNNRTPGRGNSTPVLSTVYNETDEQERSYHFSADEADPDHPNVDTDGKHPNREEEENDAKSNANNADLDMFDIELQRDLTAPNNNNNNGNNNPNSNGNPLKSFRGSPSLYKSTTPPMNIPGKSSPSLFNNNYETMSNISTIDPKDTSKILAKMVQELTNYNNASGSSAGSTANSDLEHLLILRQFLDNAEAQRGLNSGSTNNSAVLSRANLLSASNPMMMYNPLSNSRMSPHSHYSRKEMGATNRNGRNTIDTEVSDSLCRLPHNKNSTNNNNYYSGPETFPADRYQRPSNPAQAPRNNNNNNNNRRNSFPNNTYASAGNTNSSSALYRISPSQRHASPSCPQRNNNNNTTMMHASNTIKPRAVKPPSTSSNPPARRPNNGNNNMAMYTANNNSYNNTNINNNNNNNNGRMRYTKNVAPSNHSAFSECSGGETRSSFNAKNLNNTNHHMNLNSDGSTALPTPNNRNDTADTSMTNIGETNSDITNHNNNNNNMNVDDSLFLRFRAASFNNKFVSVSNDVSSSVNE